MPTVACDFCQPIGQIIKSNEAFDEVELGNYADLMQSANGCINCQAILSNAPQPGEETLEPEALIYLYSENLPDSDYQICDEGHYSLYVDIIPLPPHPAGRSSGVLVDEHWIDLRRMKSWLQLCDSTHDGTCKGFSGQSNIEPVDSLLLIDVFSECLVDAPGTVRYFALSYVWGKDPGGMVLETTLKNVHAHKKSGYLSLDRKDLLLPDTIKDSMRLVKSLGEQYLWVDRLCIVQNDLKHKAKQIDAMGSIYAQSYCTIVAAGGNDSHYGLRGIGSGSKPRSHPQQILDFVETQCLVLGKIWSAERLSLWNTRGWTFQEKFMSRRCLVFADNSVMWRCQCSIWREDMTGDPEGASRPKVDDASHEVFMPYPWPNLRQWMHSVLLYNRRNLTFESDRLSAIAGVESALRRSFPGGFCYGLPEFFFDAALLWQPNDLLKRRAGGPESGMKNCLPSWSWVGWHGFLDPKTCEFGLDYLRTGAQGEPGRMTSCTVLPLVEWHHMDRYGNRQKIRNEYAQWLRIADTSSEEVPEGWTKHESVANRRPWFTHLAADQVSFWWPVPIHIDSIRDHDLPFSPYLIFHSTRAFLTVDGLIPSLDLCRCMAISLCDADGNWAGMLRLNLSKCAIVPVGQRCELVAISSGYAENSADESHYLEEWTHAERPRSGASYHFYNVLWVRREDGWISRQALGRVEKGIWERQELEELEFRMR